MVVNDAVTREAISKKGKIFVVNHPGFTTISTTTFVDVLAKSFQSVVNFGKNNEKREMPRNPVKWGKSWNKAINHETYSKAFRLPRQDAYFLDKAL